MKSKDIHVGSLVWTKVGEDRVQVRVTADMQTRGARYRVQRVDTGTYLPKTRSAAALHESGKGYWAGMMESPEVGGRPAEAPKTKMGNYSVIRDNSDRAFPWTILHSGRVFERARTEKEALDRVREILKAIGAGRAGVVKRAAKRMSTPMLGEGRLPLTRLRFRKVGQTDKHSLGLFPGARKSQKYGGPLTRKHRVPGADESILYSNAVARELSRASERLKSLPAHERATRAAIRGYGRDPKKTRALHEKPLAARGLTSYRLEGPYGWIMIGARNHEEAMKEAARSTDHPLRKNLQVWNGTKYVFAYRGSR